MKKTVLLFLSFSMALVGCSSGGSNSKKENDPSLRQTTLKVDSSYDEETPKQYDFNLLIKTLYSLVKPQHLIKI